MGRGGEGGVGSQGRGYDRKEIAPNFSWKPKWGWGGGVIGYTEEKGEGGTLGKALLKIRH